MINKFFVSKNFKDNHKVVSILLNVRNDVENLNKSLESLFSLSYYPDNIEVIIWFDDDDESYKEFVSSSLMNKYNIKACVRERVGYANICHMLNYTALISTGDFIMPFAVDVSFLNKSWDLELYEYNKADLAIFRPLLYKKHHDSIVLNEVAEDMPIISRRVYEIMGRVAPMGSVDRYLFLVACRCGILERIYMPMLIDTTFKDWEKGRKEKQDLWEKTNRSEEALQYMREDVGAIKEYMVRNDIEGRDIPYFHVRYYDGIFNNTDKKFSVEMFGGYGKEYDVHFVNKGNNNIMHMGKMTHGMWACVFIQYYVDWQINIYRKNELIYAYDFDLENKNVLIRINSAVVDDILRWLPYVEDFREKHNCHIFCSVVEKERFQDKYPSIKFIGADEHVPCQFMTKEEFQIRKNEDKSGFITGNGVFIEYKIGKFGDPNDRNFHPENYDNIPVGKIASNILGLEFRRRF